MRLDQDQLEWIVQEVVRRLAGDDDRATANGVFSAAAGPPASKELALTEGVVTTHQLDGKLTGIGVVRVGRRAVVTPAVKDLLADSGVSLVRCDAQ